MAGTREPPELPSARGDLSAHVMARLRGRPTAATLRGVRPATDPLVDDDLQLALYLCYETHYRSFRGVLDEAEWSLPLLADRAVLERAFLDRLRDEYADPSARRGDIGPQLVDLIAADHGPSLSAYVAAQGTHDQFRELAVHRSAYQLKEADPHTWAIPRLFGDAKAALVRIQMDEYGRGATPAMHAERFAVALREMGLDAAYGAHLDRLPGSTLATTNVISLFGLHRAWRGALVGHLTVFEMCSVVPMSRYAAAAARLGYSRATRLFYDVHVVADQEHERVALDDLVGSLARDEPQLRDDILFGARAALGVEATFAGHLLDCWANGMSSLDETWARRAA